MQVTDAEGAKSTNSIFKEKENQCYQTLFWHSEYIYKSGLQWEWVIPERNDDKIFPNVLTVNLMLIVKPKQKSEVKHYIKQYDFQHSTKRLIDSSFNSSTIVEFNRILTARSSKSTKNKHKSSSKVQAPTPDMSCASCWVRLHGN